MNIRILRFETLGSTNTEAAEQARRGVPEGTCVIAREQTAGRGRHGRAWVSDADAGLYFSIVLRPELEPKFLPLLTLMSGVAVCDTLRKVGVNADIKWVNDLLVNGKKIAGILAETVETPHGAAVIVGIGVNLKASNFPLDIAETATAIESETGKAVTADEFSESLTHFIAYFYDMLGEPDGAAQILRSWQQRSSYFSGKNVRVTLNDTAIEGVTDGLDESGALRVRIADGSVKIIHAGDVRQLRSSEV
jgi:BirA family biotin operon repressor/biotin-[acetyl-CoA-carboxylase] ligase